MDSKLVKVLDHNVATRKKKTEKPVEQPQILKVEEIKVILNVEREMVVKLLEMGEIKCFFYKKQLRSSRTEVMRFIDRLMNGHVVRDIFHPKA